MVKKALILSGGWQGHQPQQTSELAQSWLEDLGFEVHVATDLAPLELSETLGNVQLIIPNWTMGTLSEHQEKTLVQAVERGCGIAGWHGGMGDAFRDALSYKLVVGGQFVAHPGNITRYTVEVMAPSDPIMECIEAFEITSEQYYMHVDPNNEVLADTSFSAHPLPWLAGHRVPVVWKRRWGKGRVFYCSIGHTVDELRHPSVTKMLQRGFAWAAGE